MTTTREFAAIAHRGGSLDGLENTFAAFRRAHGLGFRDLETDVHVTRDGVLVAFHDEGLDRVTGAAGSIAELDWSALRELRVGGREPVPLLVDLLAAFPDCRFVIDPKVDAAVEPLVEAVRTAGAVDRVSLGCFSQRRLARLRRLLPGVDTSAGPYEVRWTVAVRQLHLGAWAVPTRATSLNVPVRHGRIEVVDRRFVALAHARGIAVHVWTVNEAAEMRRLLDLGVDGIVSDDLLTLRDVLRERGLWQTPTAAGDQ